MAEKDFSSSIDTGTTDDKKKGHISHPSLALLEELAAGKKMTNFWEAMSKDPELVYYMPKKKKRQRKKRTGKKVKKEETDLKEAQEEEKKKPVEVESVAVEQESTKEIAVEEDAVASQELAMPAQEVAVLPEVEEKQVSEAVTEAEEADNKEETTNENASKARSSVDLGQGEEKDVEADEEDFSSALQMTSAPSFQDVFFPTADTHIRDFSFIDLDQMVAQLQDEVKREETGQMPNENDKIENLTAVNDITERDEKVETIVVPDIGDTQQESAVYDVTWTKRPLGIEVVRGSGGLNAWVRRVLDESIKDKITKGSYITKVNGNDVLGKSYARILKTISKIPAKDNITITFDENPKLEPIHPVGSMVRLVKLNQEAMLNNCVGFIFADMVDGRYPVKLAGSGDQVGVKPKNILLLEQASEEHRENLEKATFDFSGTYELMKTIGMTKFLRSQGMSWFKTKLRSPPKLGITIKQTGMQFNMVFMSAKGAITDEFIANKSTFRGRTWSAKETATKTAIIVENSGTKNPELVVTELNKAGEKKKIVFYKKNADTLMLEVTNNSGTKMLQEFRKIVT